MRCRVRLAFPHPALLLDCNKRYLVIADLHIGFERRFRAGLSSNSEMMADEINRLKAELSFDELIILGDVKDSIRGLSNLERKWVSRFFRKLRVKSILIPGNHDHGIERILPKGCVVADRRGLRIGDTGFLHGHTLPSLALSPSKRLVIGHVHPTYNREDSSLSGSPLWLVMRVDRKSIFGGSGYLDVIAMPAFNEELTYWGYSPRKRVVSSPLVRRIRGHLRDCWIVTLNGELIGRAEDLKYVL